MKFGKVKNQYKNTCQKETTNQRTRTLMFNFYTCHNISVRNKLRLKELRMKLFFGQIFLSRVVSVTPARQRQPNSIIR